MDQARITAAEELGIGNRAGYDDSAGIVRDMFQNHLFQVICLVARPLTLFATNLLDHRPSPFDNLVEPCQQLSNQSPVAPFPNQPILRHFIKQLRLARILDLHVCKQHEDAEQTITTATITKQEERP